MILEFDINNSEILYIHSENNNSANEKPIVKMIYLDNLQNTNTNTTTRKLKVNSVSNENIFTPTGENITIYQ